MSETFEQQPRVQRPVCPYCKLPMRYQMSEFDKQRGNLRHVMFVCSCGLNSDQVIAEALLASPAGHPV
jgi:hypothetical protein